MKIRKCNDCGILQTPKNTHIRNVKSTKKNYKAFYVYCNKCKYKRFGGSVQSKNGYKRYWNRLNSFYKHYTSKKGCFDCGIKGPREIYEFDHIDGSINSKRKYTIGASARISIKKLFSEIRKTNIVCANCHRIRTYKRDNVGNRKYKQQQRRG